MGSKREGKGLEIVEHGFIEKINKNEYHVNSSTTSDNIYVVIWKNKKWSCNCLDFKKNSEKCKHIYAVNYYLKIQKIRSKADFSKKLNCPYCEMNDLLVKFGKRYNRTGPVQRYYCKRCDKTFSGNPSFKFMKHKIETIVTSLDLYYRGLSLRQIAEHLESTQKTKISHATVQYWIKKYVSTISKYLSNEIPETSERWHADETLIPVSGRYLRLWALLDSDTRFLIASHISKKQSNDDACNLFRKGRKKTQKMPYEVVTDGLSAYPYAIKNEISLNSDYPTIHLHSSLTKAYNNKMERIMGTIKYRTKPMLGLYDENSANLFSEGFIIYYNYIRNHRALKNQTPAMAAGVRDHKMSWYELIEETQNFKKRERVNR